MGLYLCVYGDVAELEGVDVGSYADFSFIRGAITAHLEDGVRGSRFPVFMLHSDCDGSWSCEEVARLHEELRSIAMESKRKPPIQLPTGWQSEVVNSFGLKLSNLNDCFFDIDGEPLIPRLVELCGISLVNGAPILFQ